MCEGGGQNKSLKYMTVVTPFNLSPTLKKLTHVALLYRKSTYVFCCFFSVSKFEMNQHVDVKNWKSSG